MRSSAPAPASAGGSAGEAGGAGSPSAGGRVRRAAASVAVWTLLSRASGMARILVIGAVLGPTYLANVFQAGYTLPNNVFTIFAGPMVAMVVVPSVVRATASAGRAGARDVLSRVTGRLLTVAVVCALGLALLSPALGWTLVLGVPGPAHARAWLLASVLILFVAPQIVLYTVISLAVAAQQSRDRFALAAGAPTLESLATVAMVLVVGHVFGSGLEIGDTPVAMVIWLGVGSTAAVAAHTALQLYGAARVGLLVPARWGLRHSPEALDCVHRITRSIPVAAAPAGTEYLQAVIAATVPGGVLVIQLASQVFYAVSYVAGRAVSMAALPRLARAAAEAFGRLDIVVNNVGGALPRPFLATKPHHLADAFQFNVGIAHRLTQAAVPCLLASRRETGRDGGTSGDDAAGGTAGRGQGVVINISSVMGRVAGRGYLAYGTAKAALAHYTRLAAADLAPRIRVNAIAVGSVATSALDIVLTNDELRERMERTTPLGRIGDPEDIAAAVLFLASPAGGYITGKIIEVDGGLSQPNLDLGLPDL